MRWTFLNSSVRRCGVDTSTVNALPVVLAFAFRPASEVDAFLAGLTLGKAERALVNVDTDFTVFSEARNTRARKRANRIRADRTWSNSARFVGKTLVDIDADAVYSLETSFAQAAEASKCILAVLARLAFCESFSAFVDVAADAVDHLEASVTVAREGTNRVAASAVYRTIIGQ
jgi:hypothetical protein